MYKNILFIALLLGLIVAGLVYSRSKRSGPTRGSDDFRQARPLPIARYRQSDLENLPETWDWREKGMPVHISEQYECGSCWAFAAVSCLQERLWLATGQDVKLSAQYLVNCEVYCQNILDISTCDEGCEGGILEHSWLFLVDEGTPTEACQPYKNAVKQCRRNYCTADGEAFVLYRAKSAYHVTKGNETQNNERRIMYEIMTKGPVSVGFDAFSDLKSFDGKGIYRYDGKSKSIGGHAVRLIGWGPGYWLLANQFGEDWADHGVCKYPKGENYYGIESNCVAGEPFIA